MTKSRNIMSTVVKQLEAEIASDYVDIDSILTDPSVVDHDMDKGIAYSVHKIFHHLAVHKIALQEASAVLMQLQLAEQLDNQTEVEEDGNEG